MRLIVLIGLLLGSYALGQFDRFSGSYPIFSYSNDDFNSPVQIWTGCQTEFGEFIFGNDERLLRFNGRDWSFVDIDSSIFSENTPTISGKKTYKLFEDSKKNIYATRSGSFGKIVYNQRGIPIYQPLLVDNEIRGGWGIHELPNGDIFFLNHNGAFLYDVRNSQVSSILASEIMSEATNLNSIALPHGILISATHLFNDSLAKELGQGSLHFFSFKQNRILEVDGFQSGRESYNFRGYFEVNNQHYLVDQKKGVIAIEFTDNGIKRLRKSRRFADIDFPINTVLDGGDIIYLGTEKNGLVIVSKSGQIIRSFNTGDNVLDDHVYGVFKDNIGNIWLTLDNGISVLELSSEVMTWTRSDGLGGALEAVDFMGDDVIVAARSGLFYSEKQNTKLSFIRNDIIDESAFGVLPLDSTFDNNTLIISFNGIYSFNSKTKNTEWVAYEVYAWSLIINPFKPNSVLVGGEGFLGELTYDGNWEFNIIKQIDSEIRFFLEHDKRLYISVQGSGVYEYFDNEEWSLLEFENKFPLENTHFVLESFNGQIYAGTTKGLYRFENNKFVITNVDGINLTSGFASVHRLYRDKNNRLWSVIHEGKNQETNNIGYFSLGEAGELKWNRIKNVLLNRGVINSIRQKNDLVFFGSSKGLFALSMNEGDGIDNNWDVYISSIFLDDSLIVGIPGLGASFPLLNYGQTIRFNLFPGVFTNGGQIEYRTRLLGFNDEWSAFESIDFRTFEKLPHGSFVLEVQARNLNDQKSRVYSFSFVVLPPWYLTWWAYTLYVISAVFVIALSSAVSIQRVKRQNRRLENLVNERTQEISEKNSILEQQRDEIQAKTEDILDSIKYAKRLQDTILPPDDFLKKTFDDYFVFYRPKDIVSGDFYWAREINNRIIWSAADCTGHGVPGAMVSIVGNNGLLRATNEFKLIRPAAILDKLRELVLESFKAQGDNDVKDGMDLALSVLDPVTNKLLFSGANNNLLIVRNGEVLEFKGDKQPIGDYEFKKAFSEHEIPLEQGDALYMYTDGYVDQFGGENAAARENGGKKFKSKAFKELLRTIANEPMSKQLDIIAKRFDQWRGELEQIDDVCVFGVKIN